uniref:Voltage-dependent calcium channel gamma-3 subunit n=1 Tax=Oncorhynchus tshawytscha TaxID=74940 RepID=A0AAZ3PQ79_ONCTS
DRVADRDMLVTTVGAFAAFSLMTIAVGTDYWLYSRGTCKSKSTNDNDTSRKNEEVMTHSGLWRTCCLEGTFRGVCKKIDHFPEATDYEADAAEYLLRAVRASSIFPIMSVGLEFYRSRHNVILSAGIFFVASGLSNIIGIIVYISANSGDPVRATVRRVTRTAEMVGVLAVHMFIEKHRKQRAKSRTELIKKSAFSRIPSYRYRFRRRSSIRSSEAPSRDASPIGKGGYTGPGTASDLPMYTLTPREAGSKAVMGGVLNSEREFLQGGTLANTKDYGKDAANRRTTPV